MQLRLDLDRGGPWGSRRVRGLVTVVQGGGARSLRVALVRRDRSDDYSHDHVAESTVLRQGDLEAGQCFPVDFAMPADVHVPIVTSKGSLTWLVTATADRPLARDAVAEQPLDVPLPEGAQPPRAPSRPVAQRPRGVEQTHHASRPPEHFYVAAAATAFLALTALRGSIPILVLVLVVAAVIAVVGLVRRQRGPREAERLTIRAPDRVRRGRPIPVELDLGGATGFDSLRVGVVLHEHWTFTSHHEHGKSKNSRERALFETWAPVVATDPKVTLVVPADSMPSANGQNLSLRWEVVAAGDRDGQERIARHPLLVGL